MNDPSLRPIQAFTGEFGNSLMLPSKSVELPPFSLFSFTSKADVPIVEVFLATYDPSSDRWIQGHTIKASPGQTTVTFRVYTQFKYVPVRIVTTYSRPRARVDVEMAELEMNGYQFRGDEVLAVSKDSRLLPWGGRGNTVDSSPIEQRPVSQASARPATDSREAGSDRSESSNWWFNPGKGGVGRGRGDNPGSTPAELSEPLLGSSEKED
jgi:hypothetical protein